MPDPNKHAALTNAGFKIARTCSTCVFWESSGPTWGHCNRIEYEHAKHSAAAMHAGTPSIGTCPKHRFSAGPMLNFIGDDYAARYLPED